MDSDFQASHAAAFCGYGDSVRLLDRHFDFGLVVIATSGVPSTHYSTSAWVAVAEQGLFATASTTVLWNWGLKRVPASQAGIFVNLEPLVGAILGVSILHMKSLGRMALTGGALIIGAALYFSYKPQRNAP